MVEVNTRENSTGIMNENEVYLKSVNHQFKEATDNEIAEFCDVLKRTLNLLDMMFSILRRNHGDVADEDITNYKAVSFVEKARPQLHAQFPLRAQRVSASLGSAWWLW